MFERAGGAEAVAERKEQSSGKNMGRRRRQFEKRQKRRAVTTQGLWLDSSPAPEAAKAGAIEGGEGSSKKGDKPPRGRAKEKRRKQAGAVAGGEGDEPSRAPKPLEGAAQGGSLHVSFETHTTRWQSRA